MVIVATPIGNLSDLSDRARSSLVDADAWIVEDTRVSGKLAAYLEVKKSMHTLNDHSTEKSITTYADRIAAGGTLALISDAGTPCISDPGSLLVDICAERGLEIDSIPGASAVSVALTLSGFFAQKFTFLGFMARKSGAIQSELKPYAESTHTLVFFESVFRVKALLEAAGAVLGERRYVICRELTKMHQQVYRNTLPNLPTENEIPQKGECTVVIEGFRKKRKRIEP